MYAIRSYYERDVESFKAYGYNQEVMDAIMKQTEELKLFPSDDFYAGQQKMATDKKKTIRKELETNISDLKNRARLVLGANSVEFSLFRFGKAKDMADNA